MATAVLPRARGPSVSRAETRAQVLEIATRIVENVVRASGLSRAEFARDVAKILQESLPILASASG